MPTIKYDDLLKLLKEKLINNNFEEYAAELCAKILTENTFAGVASHGTNRFQAFVNLAKKGIIKPNAKPTLINSFGTWEQWNANLSPGPLAAWTVTDRAIHLAKTSGMACVTLKNTNHWMRGGTYGWQAAEQGVILISWTNAYPMMPPWGSEEAVLGNNPFVLAVPRANGHIVLDMALSQYSFGKLSTYRRAGKELPYYGGYDKQGHLSKDAGQIYDSRRPLPIGYWKGSGMAILFDLIAAILTGGQASYEIGIKDHETAVSQIFIAFDPSKSHSTETISNIADNIIASIKKAKPVQKGEEILYPGERALQTRAKNLRNGVFVEEVIWQKILAV